MADEAYIVFRPFEGLASFSRSAGFSARECNGTDNEPRAGSTRYGSVGLLALRIGERASSPRGIY